MLVNDRAIARLTPARISAVSSLIRGGVALHAWPDNLFVIDGSVLPTALGVNPSHTIYALAHRARPLVIDAARGA